MQARPSSRYTLAYDTDCGPCTRFAHIVNSLDKHEKIDFIPLVVADQQGLLDSISAPLRYRSFHLELNVLISNYGYLISRIIQK
jgi:predicted DCC family thiol-disulfide oxidoreductase YuxK